MLDATTKKTWAERDAEYAAERYLDVSDKYRDQVQNGARHGIHPDMVSDAWDGLRSAVYEFRKRAARAGHEPSAIKFNR
jgi:hypothetical protein